VKRLERKLLIEQEKVKKKLAGAKDDGVSFEQTGVDYVFLDEATCSRTCTPSRTSPPPGSTAPTGPRTST